MSRQISPCTDKAFTEAVSELNHHRVRKYLDEGYNVNLFPQDKFWELCLFKPKGNDENATKRMIENKKNIVLVILGYEYKPVINPVLEYILKSSGRDFQIILSLIQVALRKPPIQEPPPRKTSLRESSLEVSSLRESSLEVSSLQEPPLREASLEVSSLREASLEVSSLQEPPLQEPPLREASLHEESLQEPSLRKPSLREASLREAYLQEPSLRDASLDVSFRCDEKYAYY